MRARRAVGLTKLAIVFLLFGKDPVDRPFRPRRIPRSPEYGSLRLIEVMFLLPVLILLAFMVDIAITFPITIATVITSSERIDGQKDPSCSCRSRPPLPGPGSTSTSTSIAGPQPFQGLVDEKTNREGRRGGVQ